MRIPVRLLLIALMASTLALAGCSYTPARIKSEPLIEIDGFSHHHRDYRWDDRHHRDRDYRSRHHHERRYRDRDRHHHADRHDHDRRRGGFCPPGLRMQGRC